MTKCLRVFASILFTSCMFAGVSAQNSITELVDNSSNGSTTSADGKVETFTVNGVPFDMIFVEGGSFMMGNDDGDKREKPVHNEVVNHFYIGQTTVTQELWKAVMGLNPSHFRGEGLPVENVTWYECQDFIEQLNKLTGREFRLPTEAEWEYAARGGYSSQHYSHSGANAADVYRIAWYRDDSNEKTHPVATKRPNELGVYDMSGNVWEWTSDLWSDTYSSPRKGGDNGTQRVCRGGAWNGEIKHCSNSFRNSSASARRSNGIGVRLVMSAR